LLLIAVNLLKNSMLSDNKSNYYIFYVSLLEKFIIFVGCK